MSGALKLCEAKWIGLAAATVKSKKSITVLSPVKTQVSGWDGQFIRYHCSQEESIKEELTNVKMTKYPVHRGSSRVTYLIRSDQGLFVAKTFNNDILHHLRGHGTEFFRSADTKEYQWMARDLANSHTASHYLSLMQADDAWWSAVPGASDGSSKLNQMRKTARYLIPRLAKLNFACEGRIIVTWALIEEFVPSNDFRLSARI